MKILAASIALSLLAPCGRALEISLGTTNALPGSTATVTIAFSNAPVTPISAFALYLTSTNQFGVPTVTPGPAQTNLVCFVDDFSTVNGSVTQFVYRVTGLILEGASISNGLVASLQFAVPADASPGSYPISFTSVPPTSAPAGTNPEARTLIANSLLTGTAGGGVIHVLIPGEPAQVTSVTPLPGKLFLLQFSGTAGAFYTIEATTNLVPPVPWLPLTNLSADGSGLFQYLEIDATNHPQRFFRAVHP